MSSLKKFNGTTWEDSKLRKLTTATDTITTLPANIYPNDTTATVGLSGNMEQSGTPTPENPIQPSETGEMTANLLSGWTKGVRLEPSDAAERADTESATTGYIPVDYTNNTAYSLTNLYNNYNSFVAAYNANKQFVGRTTGSRHLNMTLTSTIYTSGSPTATGDVAYIRITTYKSGQQEGDINDIDNREIMLNLGSVRLPYEPYGIKIPILSANTTTPVYLGEVETTRKIKKLVLTGDINEDWNAHQTISSWYQLSITDIIIENLEMCTHYKASPNTPADIQNNEILVVKQYQSIYGRIIIKDTNCATVEDFKAYLAQQYAAGTPVTIWYVLATETTGIVNEPLRKIGDYADTLSNVTIPVTAGGDTLSVDTTLQPSEVTVNYKGWHPVTDVHERDNGAWT